MEINPEQIRTETFRRSPELNTVGIRVRVIHIPTGIFAEGVDQRSYTANKHLAMKLLKEKLISHLNKGNQNA